MDTWKKTVLITGATGGIGRATARRLARNGTNLLLHARSASETLERLTEALQEEGRHNRIANEIEIRAFFADLSVPAEVDRLVAETAANGSRIDGFVHAAGLDLMSESTRDLPFRERLYELFQVDLAATMLLAREFGERMKQAGGGAIVLLGWNEIDYGIPGDTAQLYAAVKGGVVAFMRSLAVSLAPEVRVNAISPGWIQTRWGNDVIIRSPEWDHSARVASLADRWGTPDEIAATIAYLLSEEAAFLNKQNLRLDGGRR